MESDEVGIAVGDFFTLDDGWFVNADEGSIGSIEFVWSDIVDETVVPKEADFFEGKIAIRLLSSVEDGCKGWCVDVKENSTELVLSCGEDETIAAVDATEEDVLEGLMVTVVVVVVVITLSVGDGWCVNVGDGFLELGSDEDIRTLDSTEFNDR